MNLGTAEAALGDDAAAENHHREGISINDAWYGPEHPDAATMKAILANVLMKEGKDAQAEILLKRTRWQCRKKLTGRRTTV